MNLYKIRIENGTVWDGYRFLEGDVFIEDGRIASVGGTVSGRADVTFDASGCLVTPGLIDIHTHARGISDVFGTSIDAVCLPNGVTAAADGGAGDKGDARLLEAFMVKTLAFVAVPVRNNVADFSGTEAALARFGNRTAGLKIYFDTDERQVRNADPLREVCRFAGEHGLTVMVHSTGSPIPMGELLGILRPGDICTHAYHGGPNNVSEDGFECVRQAKERGVIMDAGFAGGVHADYALFGAAVAAGMGPDTVSTDITKLSAFVRGGNYGMNLCMTVARAQGMTQEAVLRAVTSSAAKALHREDKWGVLEPGRAGDVAVLRYEKAPYCFANPRWGDCRLEGQDGYRCLLTLADGQVVYRRGDI